MVGFRIFDVGLLVVWLVWFFRLRDDDGGSDDDGPGGGGPDPRPREDPGGGGPRRPRGGPGAAAARAARWDGCSRAVGARAITAPRTSRCRGEAATRCGARP